MLSLSPFARITKGDTVVKCLSMLNVQPNRTTDIV